MSKLLILATLLGVVVFGGQASAQPSLLEETKPLAFLDSTPQEDKESKPTSKKTKTIKVRQGDTLTKIAKRYETTVDRLWRKNKNVSHPDQLKVGQRLILPRDDEKLKKRPYPQNQVQTASVGAGNALGGQPANGHGNFEWGWCTWYAQSQRPDKRFSGNAGEWIVYANSTTPKVGAVAVNTYVAGYGHVAIVRAVKGGRVLVQEMNYEGFGVVSSRWTPLSEWQGYIY